MSEQDQHNTPLITRLKALSTRFNQLHGEAEDAPGPKQAAETLQKSVHVVLDEGIAKITQAGSSDPKTLKTVKHDTLIDVLNTIKTQRVKIKERDSNNLNVLSQHNPTRVQLLKIIDDIVELNASNEQSSLQYNTDYDELAKEIRQIIRSTPKLYL